VHYDCDVILDEIQEKRRKMIETANKKGYTNDDTIRYSQELDQLIYKYQCHTKKTDTKSDDIKIAFRQMMMILPQAHLLV
jgi:stage 0 sporulation regulatory protein